MVEPLFAEALDSLANRQISVEVCEALFRVPVDQRHRLFAQLQGDPEAGQSFAPDAQVRLEWAAGLLEEWALRNLASGLAPGAYNYVMDWEGEFLAMWRKFQGSPDFEPGVASRLWMWLERQLAPEALDEDELGAIVLITSQGNVHGKVLRSLEALLNPQVDSAERVAVLESFPDVLRPGVLRWHDAAAYAREAGVLLDSAEIPIGVRDGVGSKVSRGLAVLALIVSESEVDEAPEGAEQIGSVIGLNVARASGGRPGGREKRARVEAARLELEAYDLPTWYGEWASGKVDFIRAETAEPR
ncbi:MAG: hypothetical protein ABW025_00355 [Cellulomonas sp.]